jgi:hypothetical protein
VDTRDGAVQLGCEEQKSQDWARGGARRVFQRERETATRRRANGCDAAAVSRAVTAPQRLARRGRALPRARAGVGVGVLAMARRCTLRWQARARVIMQREATSSLRPPHPPRPSASRRAAHLHIVVVPLQDPAADEPRHPATARHGARPTR